jgi:hypothetical protein
LAIKAMHFMKKHERNINVRLLKKYIKNPIFRIARL